MIINTLLFWNIQGVQKIEEQILIIKIKIYQTCYTILLTT